MNGSQFFSVAREGDVLIVVLSSRIGSLADTAILHDFAELLESVRQKHVRSVVIDFAHVSYFGSSLLEALRLLWKELDAEGGRLVVCNLSATGREILEVARFDQVWPICEGRAAALATARV